MPDVSIIFTAPPTLLYRVIKWFTGSNATHVMLGYRDELWGGDWTAAADLDGVRLYQAEQTCQHVESKFMCAFHTDAGLHSVARLINQSYDFADLFSIGLVTLVWRLFKRRIRNPWHRPNAQICSEFVARFLQAAQTSRTTIPDGCGNLPEVAQWNPESVTPGDIKAYCLRHPKLFKAA
jgi:hypothetical protein